MPRRESEPLGETKRIILDFRDLGSLNESQLQAARRALLSEADCEAASNIEVELRAERVGAAFLGIAAAAKVLAGSRGRQLRLRTTAPQVRRVFKICGLEQMM